MKNVWLSASYIKETKLSEVYVYTCAEVTVQKNVWLMHLLFRITWNKMRYRHYFLNSFRVYNDEGPRKAYGTEINREPHILVKGKVSPLQALEALRLVRGWGSHIF
jgi:hypothetical protein